MINSSAAVWAPTPKPSRRVGEVSVVRRTRCWSCIAISSVRAIQRRASARRVCLADAVGVIDGARSESGAACEQAVIGEVVKGFSQYGRGVHDDLLQRVHRHGARLHRGIPRDLELAHHLDGAVRSLGNGRRLTRQTRTARRPRHRWCRTCPRRVACAGRPDSLPRPDAALGAPPGPGRRHSCRCLRCQTLQSARVSRPT